MKKVMIRLLLLFIVSTVGLYISYFSFFNVWTFLVYAILVAFAEAYIILFKNSKIWVTVGLWIPFSIANIVILFNLPPKINPIILCYNLCTSLAISFIVFFGFFTIVYIIAFVIVLVFYLWKKHKPNKHNIEEGSAP